MEGSNLEEFDESRDDPRTKIIQIDSNKIFMKRTDPYGFIELSLERGSLPNSLKEAKFTTWEEAKKAVARYMDDRRKVALDAKPVIPTLERKKVS